MQPTKFDLEQWMKTSASNFKGFIFSVIIPSAFNFIGRNKIIEFGSFYPSV